LISGRAGVNAPGALFAIAELIPEHDSSGPGGHL